MTSKQKKVTILTLVTLCLVVAAAALLKNSASSKPEPEPKPQEESEAEVQVVLPEKSRGDTADAVVTNKEGTEYNYRLFKQNAGYDNYSDYLSAHGCSTCALTTILRTTVPELSDLTPDKAITDVIYPVIGEKAFNKNFDKAMRRQMPITLSGMMRIFDEYGVEYKKPTTDPDKRAKEIRKWLRNGDPVIFTFGNGSSAHLSRHTHTVLLLGIDDDGKVILGDSLHKSKSYWGSDGLLKTGKLTVKDMLSFIKRDDGWTVNKEKPGKGRIFYKDSADRGYLLIRKDSAE